MRRRHPRKGTGMNENILKYSTDLGIGKDVNPNTINFYSGTPDFTEVLRISKDGIWANSDVPVDESAKAVLAALDSQIKYMVQKAVAQEREACAKVCENQPSPMLEPLTMYTGSEAAKVVLNSRKYLAAAIRARGQA